MEDNPRKNWNNHPLVVTIIVTAAVISIVVFMTGKQSLPQFLSSENRLSGGAPISSDLNDEKNTNECLKSFQPRKADSDVQRLPTFEEYREKTKDNAFVLISDPLNGLQGVNWGKPGNEGIIEFERDGLVRRRTIYGPRAAGFLVHNERWCRVGNVIHIRLYNEDKDLNFQEIQAEQIGVLVNDRIAGYEFINAEGKSTATVPWELLRLK